jgi:hypothetical protein
MYTTVKHRFDRPYQQVEQQLILCMDSEFRWIVPTGQATNQDLSGLVAVPMSVDL